MNLTVVFKCGCMMPWDDAKEFKDLSDDTKQSIRSLNKGYKFNQHMRFCSEHGKKVYKRVTQCVDCGVQVNYYVAGIMPCRCGVCAKKRHNVMRAAEMRRYLERKKAEMIGKPQSKREPKKKVDYERKWDCINYEQCLFSPSCAADMCVRCDRYKERESMDHPVQRREWSEPVCYNYF